MGETGELVGKVIMVTGAAVSLGAAFADHFTKVGATVWRTDIDSGPDVHHLDVTKRADWEAGLRDVLAAHGRVDGLVNNAAVGFGQRPIWEEPDDEVDQLFEVNIKGTWLGTQIVGKAMADRGFPGSIVNVSSTSGVMGTKGYAGYGTTRWAVRGLSKFAAGDFAQFGIRVNSLHPHGVRGTGMATREMEVAGVSPEVAEERAARKPLGRMATTDDVAHAASFLLSDRSSFMTGREFVVDGGASLAPIQ
jgi:3alpha(or 20beta)-hydroxysteroid dehydrogenase